MSDNGRPIVAIIYNSGDHVRKARINLISAIEDAGYDVVLLSPADDAIPELEHRGVKHYPLRMSQYGMDPLGEIAVFREMTRALKEIKPVITLAYTIKPNIFGNFAAWRCGVPVLNNVAGAGRLFTSTSRPIALIIQWLFQVALNYSSTVFFQNKDDRDEFISQKIVKPAKAQLVPGSGVDLKRYRFTPQPNAPRRFLFIGRLLQEKGVEDFIVAATRVAAKHPGVTFRIVGEHETHPSYISESALQDFEEIPGATYLGTVHPSRIAEIIKEASCLVLPSYYREGIPRVLLEACASGRPIITTDNYGCRDVVRHGVNGYKVSIKDSSAVAEAMIQIAEASDQQIDSMSRAARETAEVGFDEQIVINAYLDKISKYRLKS